jgi:alkanesulfonate monooxygenase SsuD/methylene tetrahydromethanopterin reductase-like flavin-dependent oxidoreductase (luciferase family)
MIVKLRTTSLMSQRARDQIGRFGIWRGERQITPELAARIEELGFGALWLGSASGDLAAAEEFLAATTTLIVATGIVNMWQYEPHQVAASFQRVEERFPAGSCWAWARATPR